MISQKNTAKTTWTVLLTAFFFLTIGVGVAEAQPVFKVDDIDISDDDFIFSDVNNDGTLSEKQYVDVIVTVTNIGEAGSMNIEAGFYKSNWLDRIQYTPFNILTPQKQPNCVEGEQNVGRVKAYLEAGEIQQFKIQDIRVPLAEADGLDRSFELASQTFDKCWTEEDQDIFVGGRDRIDVVIRDDPLRPDIFKPGPTCFDNQLNGDETDIDAGGSCGPAQDGKLCEINSDCKETSICVENEDGLDICQPRSQSTTTEKVTSDVKNFVGGSLDWIQFAGVMLALTYAVVFLIAVAGTIAGFGGAKALLSRMTGGLL